MAKKRKRNLQKSLLKMLGGKKKVRKAINNYLTPSGAGATAGSAAAALGLAGLAKNLDVTEWWDRIRDDGQLLLDLLQAWARGEYTDVSKKSVIIVTGSLAYFLSPVDVIPDWIPGAGQIDDAAVALFAIKTLGDEAEKYRKWKKAARTEKKAAA
jgi:uncharacterized membrane protein YkvA (DUF1232 family)